MSIYKHEKERTREVFSSGIQNEYSSSVFPQRTHYIEGGCMTRYVEHIDYNSGSKFNSCAASKSSTVTGIAATRTCFGRMRCDVKPGQPATASHGRREPTGTLSDSVIVYQQSIGDRTLEASPGDVAQARFDAYQKLIYLVPGVHMNIGRSLIELKDTKSTIKPLVEFTKWGHQVTRKGGVFLKVGAKKVWKKLDLLSSMASIASAYLWYSFGVEPTVSDVKTFIRQTANGSLKVLGSKQRLIPKGTVMVQRFSAMPKTCQVGSSMFTQDTTWGGDGSVSAEESIRVKLPYYSTSFHWPTLTSTQRFPWQSARRVTVRGIRGCYFAEALQDITIPGSKDLSTRMKWNCPLGASLWELTPFSFVLDWFVNIGKYIENLDHLTMGVSYRSRLGPVWDSTQEVTEVWRPALVRCGFTGVENPEAPSDGSYGGYLTLKGVWAAQPMREDRSIVYTRKIGAAPGLPPLSISDEVKAYQISSGMALLAQFANGLR